VVKRLILAFGVIAMAACGGSSTSVSAPTTTPTTGAPVTPLHGTMTAVIDGLPWTAIAITTAAYNNGTLSIGGADGSNPIRSIGLAVSTGGPGTFAMNAVAGAARGLVSIGIGPTWTTALGGSGTLTVSTISSTGASGTFSFVATPIAGGAAGNKNVTSGTFNITF